MECQAPGGASGHSFSPFPIHIHIIQRYCPRFASFQHYFSILVPRFQRKLQQPKLYEMPLASCEPSGSKLCKELLSQAARSCHNTHGYEVLGVLEDTESQSTDSEKPQPTPISTSKQFLFSQVVIDVSNFTY